MSYDRKMQHLLREIFEKTTKLYDEAEAPLDQKNFLQSQLLTLNHYQQQLRFQLERVERESGTDEIDLIIKMIITSLMEMRKQQKEKRVRLLKAQVDLVDSYIEMIELMIKDSNAEGPW